MVIFFNYSRFPSGFISQILFFLAILMYYKLRVSPKMSISIESVAKKFSSSSMSVILSVISMMYLVRSSRKILSGKSSGMPIRTSSKILYPSLMILALGKGSICNNA